MTIQKLSHAFSRTRDKRRLSRCLHMGAMSILVWAGLFQQVPSVNGQATVTATLSGAVTDNTGAALPGAVVTLSDRARNFVRTFTTSSDGAYVFSLLPPSTYTLKIEQSGFETYIQQGIVLTVGQSATQDVRLQLGKVTQTLTVSGGAPLLETSNPNVAKDVTNVQVNELPLNLRNVFGLVALDSSVNNSIQKQTLNPNGVNSDSDDQDISFFNFGGARFGTTAFLLDGAWDAIGSWGGDGYVIGVDETQEFKIQTNAFTAQYGLSMGNIVNAISKSGTGQLHGDVFGFLRNDELDANNFFNNRAGIRRPEFIQTQWGGTVGGPFSIPRIYEQREKTFFFASYQRRRAALPATLVTTLPTTAFTGGDFSALLGPQIGTDALGRPVFQGQIYNPFTTRQITAGQVDAATGLTATESGFVRDPFVGNIILPTMFDPVAVKATAFYPAPTSPGLVNNFTASAGEPAGEDAWTGRIDHNVSDKTRVWGRYSQKEEFLTLGAAFLGAGNPAGPLNGVPDNRLQVGTGFSHTFDPSLVMNFNVGWLRWVEERKPQGAGFKPSALGLAPILDSCCANFPAFAPGGFFGLGAASNGGGARVIVPRRTISIASDFTKVRGRHSIQWGWQFINFGEIDHFGSQAFFNFPINFTQGPNPLAANPVTGSGFASFLLGTGSGSVSLNADTIGTKDYWGWYIQDDWKATPKLTLNLGVRYDIQMAPTDRHDRFSSFDFSGPNPISAAVGFSVPGELVFTHDLGRRGAFEIQKTNFAPRVGLAYQTSNKLVFRSGFAMFYVPAFQLNPPLQGFTQSTPFVGTVDGITPTSTLKNAFTGGLIQPPRFSLGGLTNVGLSVAAPEPRLPTPYVEQWTGGFQYQLANNDRLSVTYVGNHGVRLSFASLEKDQLPDSALALGNALLDAVPNPFFGHISASSCGLDQPTVPRGQLLRPYPEYCSVTDVQPPASFSNYHSVVVEWNHRWSEGVQFLASYTISKYLDNSTGPNGWANWSSQQVRDNYNLSAEKALDEDDIPNSFVFSWIYQLPVGRGKHFGENLGGALNQIVGGWQVSGVATFKDGFPLSIWAVNNNTTSFGGFQRPNRVGKATISNPAVEQAFNTAAFAQPPAFTFGNVARAEPNLRAPGLNNFDIGIGKYFNWREKLRFEYRAEFFNAFNRVNFYAPAQAFGAPGFGQLFSAFPGRDIQMALKIYF